MSNKTRKHIRLGAVAMSIAIIGALAAFLVLMGNPGATSAHEPGEHGDNFGGVGCADMVPGDRAIHDASHANLTIHGTNDPCPDSTTPDPDPDPVMAGAVMIDGFSASPSGKADLKITIDTSASDGTNSLPIGSKIVLYLDDKFQVPETVARGTVNFVSYMTPSNGSPRVANTKVDDGDSEQLGEDAWAVIVTVPNMGTEDDPEGVMAGDDLTLAIDEAAGIKSPTEAGSYKYGYQVVRPGGESQDFDMVMGVMSHTVNAKASLDDKNNKRGYELTITGAGFNSGSTATAYVLKGQMSAPYCSMVVSDGESLGSATVGSDHKAVITAEVTGGSKGDFSPGMTNYICVRDDNSPDRETSAKAVLFDLQHSIAVEPSDVASGEEVTVKLRDYPAMIQIEKVVLDGKKTWYRVNPVDDPATTANEAKADDFDIRTNASVSEITFDMPGGVSGDVEVAVVATKPDGMDDDTDRDKVGNKTATITVNPSSLELSQTEVAPNASIIISGSGFNEGRLIAVENITIDGERLVVDDAGTVSCNTEISMSGDCVQVTSSGEFTATVRVWTHSSSNANPALDDEEFTVKVKDQDGFEGKAKITIKSATVKVTPETASPRDFIVISGENWPISTPEMDNSVTIKVDNRTRTVDVDSTGRFRYEYQLRATIGIGDEHEVTVSYEDIVNNAKRDDIEEEATFSVVEADISVTPAAAAPGQTISVEIGGMRPYTLIDAITVGRVSLLGNQSVTTDREGDAMVSGITVPYLDPGHYPLTVQVGTDTRVVQFEMLAEAAVAGVAAELPGAADGFGDNLDAIFHFNNVSKEWTFFDPRPEFADLNTLGELVGGQPYWVLVKETQEDVDWNGRLVNFTCAGDDCWNLEIW